MVSFPGEPGPTLAMVKPWKLRSFWRERMSTPVVPWVKGRVNVGWEEDGGEESPVRGVIPPVVPLVEPPLGLLSVGVPPPPVLGGGLFTGGGGVTVCPLESGSGGVEMVPSLERVVWLFWSLTVIR